MQRVEPTVLNAPEGTLHLGKSKGSVQYFHYTSSDGKKYIPQKDIKLAGELAQKEYNEKILAYAKRASVQLQRLLKEYEDEKIESIFLSEHQERQKLITPVEPTFEQLTIKWQANTYEGKGFSEEAPVIHTNGGIRVRSKSEKIIADYFESKGIPYKYEHPLVLKPYGTIYPDFTLLSKKLKKEIYWEHEGMLDNPDYARSAVKKLELYEKNGIYIGHNLILTLETSVTALNTDLVKELVYRHLL